MTVEKKCLTDLTQEEIELLASVLQNVIPPLPAQGLPSPNLTQFMKWMDQKSQTPQTRFFLNTITEYARHEFQLPFGQLDQTQQTKVMQMVQVKQFRSWINFFSLVATTYYQDQRVLHALGLNSTPFPEGYRLQNSDLELLEGVYERGKIFRDPKI